MTSLLFGLGVWIILSTVALVALGLHPHLPPKHRSKETQDAVRIGMGMVVALSAFVLGLLIASTKNTFDTATHDLERFSTQIVLVDQTMRAYGPQTAPARDALQNYVRRALAGT